jgi:hypothetical protein
MFYRLNILFQILKLLIWTFRALLYARMTEYVALLGFSKRLKGFFVQCIVSQVRSESRYPSTRSQYYWTQSILWYWKTLFSFLFFCNVSFSAILQILWRLFLSSQHHFNTSPHFLVSFVSLDSLRTTKRFTLWLNVRAAYVTCSFPVSLVA